MPKKVHTEEQIIAALKQHENGSKTAEICRKLGISQATFYLWKKQYAGSRGSWSLIGRRSVLLDSFFDLVHML